MWANCETQQLARCFHFSLYVSCACGQQAFEGGITEIDRVDPYLNCRQGSVFLSGTSGSG